MSSSLEKSIVDYWNNQPCNVRHSNQQIGTKEYFDEVTDKRYRAEPHILDFADFKKWKDLRVLEIGCGIGTDAEQFSKHGADYTGIDISDESLKISKTRFEVLNLKGNFYQASVSDLNFLKTLGKFDLVYSFGVLHHFPGIEDHLRNISLLLKDSGELRFMVYAKNSWKYAMIQSGLDQYEAQKNCPYADVFTKDSISEILKKYFYIDEIKQDHCFMYNIDSYKQGIFELDPWFAAMSNDMIKAIKEYLGWHLLVKAKKIS